MGKLRWEERFKDKKFIANLAVVLCIGVVFLVCVSSFFKQKTEELPVLTSEETTALLTATEKLDYERALEGKLETILAQIEGAGNVEVMLTLSYGREIIVAEDAETSETRISESDAQGGRREQHETSFRGTKIMITGRDGSQQPLILKEIEPKVEGVLIVAQGGEDIFVKDGMIKAAQTILGVEPHKVQVLKMK